MSAFKRTRNGKEDPFYSIKFTFQGTQVVRKTPYTTKPEAERYARQLRTKLLKGHVEALVDSRLRTPVAATTVKQLIEAYERHATEIKPATRVGNVRAFKLILATVLQAESHSPILLTQPLTLLDADLIHRYKSAIEDRAAAATDLRAQQIRRTAKSIIRQARSLFTASLLSTYRRSHLQIPATVHDFLKEPTWRGSVKKLDYAPPADHILAKTFAELEKLKDPPAGQTNNTPLRLNMYKAIWLALGFGLRKSEIAAAQNHWFITRDGKHFIAAQYLQKNHTAALDIACLDPAWAHLSAVGVGQPDSLAYVLEGTATDRTEETFREISAWMRSLGWATQKTIHEFRAWSGCQVALTHGIIAARDWLRHASTTTTEANYGRYLKTRETAVTLQIPTQTATPEIKIAEQ